VKVLWRHIERIKPISKSIFLWFSWRINHKISLRSFNWWNFKFIGFEVIESKAIAMQICWNQRWKQKWFQSWSEYYYLTSKGNLNQRW